MIKTWEERCVEHPDHQTGMVSYAMIQARMQEEIDELRAAVFDPDWDRVKSLEESLREHMAEIQRLKALRAALAQPEQEPLTGLELCEIVDATEHMSNPVIAFARGIERVHGIE